MHVINTANIQTWLKERVAKVRIFYKRLKTSSPVRLIFLAAGIALISYGQYLMEQRLPQGAPSLNAKLWNITYQLNIPNYDNAYKALPYLVGGLFLCMLMAMPSSWKNPFRNWTLKESSHQGIRGQLLPIVVGLLLFVYLLVQLGKHRYAPIYLIFWLISIPVFSRVFWKWDRSTAMDLSLEISYFDWFCLTGLLLLGFTIGSLSLQDVPIAVIPDEDQFWQTARVIAVRQFQPAIFEAGVFAFPIASSVFQGWVLRIFGISLWAWRFSSVIAGVLAVIPLYLLAKEWFGRAIAIVTCVLMIANPYFLSFIRLGYNNSQSLLPVTLSIYFFAVAARKDSYFYLWLSGLTAGFGFYTYSATWIVPVVLCFSSLYLWFLKDFSWKNILITLGIFLFGWSAAFLPQVVYALSRSQQGSLVYRIFVASFANVYYGQAYYGRADLANTMPLIHIGEHTLFYDPVIYGELIFRGAMRTFLALFDPYIISNHFLITGLLGVVTPVLFLVGLVVSLRYRKQLRFGLPLLWCFGGIIFLSVLSAFPPAQTHLVSTIPVLALISAIGLIAVIESFMGLVTRPLFLQRLVRNTLMTIAALVILFLGFQKYYVTMPVTYLPSFENIPLWMARRIETPVDLIYLGQPQHAYRIQQLLNTTPVSHHLKVAVNNSFSPDDKLLTTPTIIFIEAQPVERIPLLQTPPAGFHAPVKYYDEDGQLIGYAMTNTDIDLKPTVGINEGLRSLTQEPVRYILVFLVATFLIFGFFASRETRLAPAYQRNLP